MDKIDDADNQSSLKESNESINEVNVALNWSFTHVFHLALCKKYMYEIVHIWKKWSLY